MSDKAILLEEVVDGSLIFMGHKMRQHPAFTSEHENYIEILSAFFFNLIFYTKSIE